MKRYFLSPFAAVLTFLFGISIVGIFILSAPIPEVEDIESKCDWRYQKSEQEKGSIEIVYQGSYSYDSPSGVIVEGAFLIKNNSLESAYYFGKHKGHLPSHEVKPKDKTKPFIQILSCGNGIEEQELKPGESITAEINVPYKQSFEVAFKFNTGNSRTEKVVWAKVNKQKTYNR